MTTIEYTEKLTVTSCWCGIRLAVPDNLLRWARQSESNSIHCPIGHTFVFGAVAPMGDDLRETRS